jgi:hypothetical protein
VKQEVIKFLQGYDCILEGVEATAEGRQEGVTEGGREIRVREGEAE